MKHWMYIHIQTQLLLRYLTALWSTSNFSSEFRKRALKKIRLSLIENWAHTPSTHENLAGETMLPSPSTHHPPKLCKAFIKAQRQTDKMAHLESKLTLKANSSTLQKWSGLTPLPPPNWQPNSISEEGKPSLPEVELHCQKLKESLPFMVILIRHACLLQKYLINPLIEARAKYNMLRNNVTLQGQEWP